MTAREEITNFICNTYDLLEAHTKTSENSTHFLNMTKDMTDKEFYEYTEKIIYTSKLHYYFEMENFEREPRFEEIEKADQFTNAKLFDYIVFPHLSPDKAHPVMSINKIFNGNLNIRRVQQLL